MDSLTTTEGKDHNSFRGQLHGVRTSGSDATLVGCERHSAAWPDGAEKAVGSTESIQGVEWHGCLPDRD